MLVAASGLASRSDERERERLQRKRQREAHRRRKERRKQRGKARAAVPTQRTQERSPTRREGGEGREETGACVRKSLCMTRRDVFVLRARLVETLLKHATLSFLNNSIWVALVR